MKIFPSTKIGWVRAGLLLAVPLGYFYLLPLSYFLQYAPRQGDVLFQSLPKLSGRVRMIEGVSGSAFSHCGVVINKNGRWYVTESLGDVHDTPLFSFIQQGRWSRFSVYRLKTRYAADIPLLIKELLGYKGRLYDYKYSFDEEFVYCSELIYKSYLRATGTPLGSLKPLRELNWQPYAAEIAAYEEGPPPLDRLMITPGNLSQAEQLEQVYSYGY